MDVNQIFKDLSVLVHEQGDIVGQFCLKKLIFLLSLVLFLSLFLQSCVYLFHFCIN